jgi:hypothetical protein
MSSPIFRGFQSGPEARLFADANPMKVTKIIAALLLLNGLLLAQPALRAQSSTNEPKRGPFWSGTLRGPKSNDAIAMKGLALTLGANRDAFICYDTDLMRVSLAWTGEFLEFGNTLTRIEWPPPPQVKGRPLFGVKSGPGWAKGGALKDPRPNEQGPLPKDWARYKGLFVNGDQVVLQYTVGAVEVLELPGYSKAGEQSVFTRTLQFTKAANDLVLVLADGVSKSELSSDLPPPPQAVSVNLGENRTLALAGVNLPRDAKLEVTPDGQLLLQLLRVKANQIIRLAFSDQSSPQGFASISQEPLRDLRPLTKGGPALWTEILRTKGTRSESSDAYVVDTITEPFPNPYNTRMFFGGFDFFPDGRAAICTFHGDVWIVSGIDDGLENLSWKRFASGMFQPLGLKVVKNTVYVLGRDQITRLHDLNKDGEADYYENFNNDMVVTSNYHEFSMDLHTDTEGNFYFAKGAPWEPAVTSPHQGCIIKIAKDGSKLEVVATGLRAPNGMTVGPRNEITVSDNQGHWMPASKLNWVVRGGFYGMTPAAQRSMVLQRGGTNFTANPSDPQARKQFQFKGWDANSPMPQAGYDEPICWLPMNMDNSSGGQLWATSKNWGPLQNRLLFMSYGKCTLFEVMLSEVDGVRQAAMVQLPLKFNSGIMRGRVHPRDGQVYLCGLKGWQTSATRDGGFYRVRYTGQPVRLPVEFFAHQKGLQIQFSIPLLKTTAIDPGSYSVERWNYHWSGAYGSPDYSVNNPSEKKRDRLEVKAAHLSADGKTVHLEIDDMKPCDQLKLKFSVEAADGSPLTQEIYGTVHQLGAGPRDS